MQEEGKGVKKGPGVFLPLGACRITLFSEADGKCADARHPTSRGRRTYKYAAVTRDEDNTADGRFPTPS